MATSPRESIPQEQQLRNYHHNPSEQNRSLEQQHTTHQSNYPHPTSAGQHPYQNPAYNSMSGGDSLEIPRANLHRNLIPSPGNKMARDSNPQPPRNGGSDNNDMYNNYASSSGSPHMQNSPSLNTNNGQDSRPPSNSGGRNAALMAKYQNEEPVDKSSAGSLGSLMGMFNQFTSKQSLNKTNDNLNQITKILADASGEPPVDFRNSFNQSSRLVRPGSAERTSSPKMSVPGQAIPSTGHESMAASKRAMYGGSGPTPSSNGGGGGGGAGQPSKRKRKNAPSATQSVPDGRELAPPQPDGRDAAPPGGPSPANMMGGMGGGMGGMPGMPQMTPQMMAQYAQQYAAAMPPAMRDVYMQQYQQYQAAMQQYGAHMQGAGAPGKS